MNDNIFYYAKQMGDLGEKISLASKYFPEINPNISEKDIRKIKDNYDICLGGIEKFKECQKVLLSIDPPAKVKKEHETIIEMIQMFLDGTEIMFQSINIDNAYVDKKSLEHGLSLQTQGQVNSIKLCNQIADKLTE